MSEQYSSLGLYSHEPIVEDMVFDLFDNLEGKSHRLDRKLHKVSDLDKHSIVCSASTLERSHFEEDLSRPELFREPHEGRIFETIKLAAHDIGYMAIGQALHLYNAGAFYKLPKIRDENTGKRIHPVDWVRDDWSEDYAQRFTEAVTMFDASFEANETEFTTPSFVGRRVGE